MRAVLLALAVAAALPVSPAAATEGQPARFLLVAERLPLGAVLRAIGQRHPGRALGAHVIERAGRSLYRIKWLGEDGKVREIIADTATGEIMSVR